MILKSFARDEHSVVGNTRTVYVDRIEKVVDHGYVLAENHAEEGGGTRISVTRDELLAWVAKVWGTEREFADELWPEFRGPDEHRTIECVHLTRTDGSMVLALLDGSSFLLSENGDTIDRLR